MANKKKADLKVVVVGDMHVGKTSLLKRYIEGVFDENEAPTLGASFFMKEWGDYNIAVWDTAGQERFAGLGSFYCRGASAAILAFDLNEKASFDSLRTRFLSLLGDANQDCLHVVVGTKLDLVTESQDKSRQVQTVEGVTFAKNINESISVDKTVIPYFETSGKTGENVEKLFEYIFGFCLPLNEEQKRLSSRGHKRGPVKSDIVVLGDGDRKNTSNGKCGCVV